VGVKLLRTPQVDADLEKHQMAAPAAAKDVKARDPFPVYYSMGESVLVPKYSPLAKSCPIELPRPGDPDQYLRWQTKTPLKDSQKPGAERAYQVLLKDGGCLIKGDTGSGKTVVGLNMAYRLQPKTTLVLVDQLDIAKQWAVRARQFLPDVSLEFLMPQAEAKEIMSAVGEASEPTQGVIIIATAQSLYRSTKYTPENPIKCELLICDEVHVFGAPTFMHAIFKVDFGRSIGLTATDDRKDGLDWVFRQCLGWPVMEFEGEVMSPLVIRMPAPSCDIKTEEWRRAWCRKIRGFTWEAKCKECAYYPSFPKYCGGNLPQNSNGQPNWGMLNRAGLVSAWSTHPEYLAWLQELISYLMKRKRRVFFFGEGRSFLITLYQWSVQKYGEQLVGIYLGKGKAADDAIDVSAQRDDALDKPLTFATYGVARKAIDVKAKDTAVFATPISDARQAAGRVRRVAENKKQPVILVPVPAKIYPFVSSWKKIEQQFREAGWTIQV